MNLISLEERCMFVSRKIQFILFKEKRDLRKATLKQIIKVKLAYLQDYVPDYLELLIDAELNLHEERKHFITNLTKNGTTSKTGLTIWDGTIY